MGNPDRETIRTIPSFDSITIEELREVFLFYSSYLVMRAASKNAPSKALAPIKNFQWMAYHGELEELLKKIIAQKNNLVQELLVITSDDEETQEIRKVVDELQPTLIPGTLVIATEEINTAISEQIPE